jgi:hypothetical protein
MKQWGFALAFLTVLGGFDFASAQPIRTRLEGVEEVPSVITEARGIFRGRIRPGGDSITYELTYRDLQADITQAHIHVAQQNVNGGIVLWLCGTDSNPGPAGTPACPDPRSGTISGTLTADNLVAVATQQVADFSDVVRAIREGVAYANVHTAVSTGGEIRGQIRVTQND